MKKFISFLFLFLFLIANFNICFAGNVISNRRGYVFQALDDGALGYICPKYAITNIGCMDNPLVYFDFNFDFVDKQMFKLPKEYSFYAQGVYKYTNMEKQRKTVRKVGLIYRD